MKLRLVTLICVLSGFSALGFQSSPSNRPWPPGVQQGSSASPPLPPAEALKTFYMPPGYHLELVAAEPLVQDPVAIDWDADGRLWVVEYPAYVRDLQLPEPLLEPLNRIVVLEDTNNDGRMDKRTVFADQLVQGRSVKVLDKGVLVHEPPDIWLMKDTNGDLKMDTKEKVATGHGRREGGVEGNANSFVWGLDNWLHSAGSSVSFNLRLKDGKFDQRPTASRGEWGVTQDDAGRMFRNSSESALRVDLIATPYYARNPNLVRTRGSDEPLSNDQKNINDVWPIRPNPGTNRAYQFGVDRPDGTLAQFTAACGPVIYRGDRLPAELYGNAFVAEPTANFVSRIILDDDGTSLRGRKAYDNAEFIASTDERFRPVFLSNAPDGTLFIVDFYRGVVQDRASTTLYLRDYIVNKKLDAPMGVGMGRIYRVAHDSTRRDVKPALSRATPAQLVQALSHPNGWWRDTAQRLLVERGNRSVVASLKTMAGSAPQPYTRLKALSVLDGNDTIDVPTLTRALADANRDVRAFAIRIAERWLGEANHPIHAAVRERLDDTDWAVREQLAASLGLLPAGPRETAMAALLERHAGDPVVVDAALSGLRGQEVTVLDALLQSAGPQSAPKETAIIALTATIARGGQDSAIQAVLAKSAEETRPAWQRAALVRGMEVVLLNASIPGSGRRGIVVSTTAAAVNSPGAPCPTCPGGRAGPGGAYAFSDARGGGAAPATAPTVVARGSAGGGRGAGGPRLRLNSEPSTFSAMTSQPGDLSTRAAALLARVDWPGKPGAAAPLTPLTAAEQRRFDAGREVYRNICQACHQPDGRGLDRVAPTLIGSPLTLAPADITARILLNGKEGPIGLMPPIGLTLNDDQIASVLTYARREWGQPGTPVDPETVRTVRAQTAARTRPWTHAELMAMLPGGGR